jgi:hypothetical protein
MGTVMQTRKQFFPLEKGNLLKPYKKQAYYLRRKHVAEDFIPAGTPVMFLCRINKGWTDGQLTFLYKVLHDGKIVFIYHNGSQKPYEIYENIKQ